MKPELTIDKDGTKYWFVNGLLHNENGPAIEHTNGTKYWYKNDQYHREDGPAIELLDGDKYWYKDGKRMRPEFDLIKIPETEEEMLQALNQFKFVKVDDNYYYINRYIKEFKKEWYEKYRLLFE